jgi:hypothetical protein
MFKKVIISISIIILLVLTVSAFIIPATPLCLKYKPLIKKVKDNDIDTVINVLKQDFKLVDFDFNPIFTKSCFPLTGFGDYIDQYLIWFEEDDYIKTKKILPENIDDGQGSNISVHREAIIGSDKWNGFYINFDDKEKQIMFELFYE